MAFIKKKIGKLGKLKKKCKIAKSQNCEVFHARRRKQAQPHITSIICRPHIMSKSNILYILPEILISHAQSMPHKTRRLLASTCTLLKSRVDKYYTDLQSKIKKREISLQDLWEQKVFDIESFLKYYHPALNTDPYPEYRERGFYLYRPVT